MKKTLFIVPMMLCSIMLSNTINAQSKTDIKNIRDVRNEISKMTKEELNSKVSKDAKKEAKNLESDGWKAPAGALPIARQLDRSYNLQYELDEDLMPKYLIGQAISVGTAYDAAKMQAMTLAKKELAGLVATEVAAKVDVAVENKQLSDEEAASIISAVSKGNQLIVQSIGRVTTIVELYREKGKNKEVQVRVAYRTDQILKAAKDIIRKELEKNDDKASEKVGTIF